MIDRGDEAFARFSNQPAGHGHKPLKQAEAGGQLQGEGEKRFSPPARRSAGHADGEGVHGKAGGNPCKRDKIHSFSSSHAPLMQFLFAKAAKA